MYVMVNLYNSHINIVINKKWSITMKIIMLLLLAFLFGCSEKNNLDAPREFFKNNIIGIERDGSDRDYGIVKWNDPKHHVISVHGFVDDYDVCRKISDHLNVDACKELDGKNCLNPYSCIPLN